MTAPGSLRGLRPDDFPAGYLAAMDHQIAGATQGALRCRTCGSYTGGSVVSAVRTSVATFGAATFTAATNDSNARTTRNDCSLRVITSIARSISPFSTAPNTARMSAFASRIARLVWSSMRRSIAGRLDRRAA